MNQPSAKPTPSESVSIESITLDFDHILTHAGGDPVLLIQLCGTFLNELPMRAESLCRAIEDRDNPGTERALQKLRHCLIVFGYGQVSVTAEVLESAFSVAAPASVQREWKRLQHQLQLLVPQVQRLMLEMSNPKTAVQ